MQSQKDQVSAPSSRARQAGGAAKTARAPKTPLAYRIASGAAAGLVATVLMDAAGTLFWERAMSPSVQKREREVEPRFPLAVLGERIARRIGAQSIEQTGEQISTAMHWAIGLACGALHGLISETLPLEKRALGTPVAAGMLAVDEFGFPAAGLCPWPPSFPWQTHARATFAHLVYGTTMAIFYEGMTSHLSFEREMRRAA